MTATEFKIVVSLGTDFHRFDRLVGWVDEWLASLDKPPSCLVQYGASRRPEMAEGIERMPRLELLEFYRHADLVIVQGGPGSILDAREAGHIPLAVPRLPLLNEVVDAHQVAFSSVMERQGEAVMVSTLEELMRLGAAALENPALMRTPPRTPGGADAVKHLERILSDFVSTPRRRVDLGRFREVWFPH